jgi:hypothetical protein
MWNSSIRRGKEMFKMGWLRPGFYIQMLTPRAEAISYKPIDSYIEGAKIIRAKSFRWRLSLKSIRKNNLKLQRKKRKKREKKSQKIIKFKNLRLFKFQLALIKSRQSQEN